MKTSFFLALGVFFSSLYGGEFCDSEMLSCYTVEASVGYFYPYSKSLRKTTPGGDSYQLMATYKWRESWGLFLAGDYFYQSGHSTGDESKCSFWLLPLTLGVKTTHPMWCSVDKKSRVEAYFLAGPRWNMACMRTDANYMQKRVYASGAGIMGGLGLNYLYHKLALKGGIDFSYGKVRAHQSGENLQNPSIQVGGLFASIGFELLF